MPAAEIADYPRFSYRGAHLDVSRHFVTKDSVLRFIDMLALHNINRMHWHITDDQGWRIEIKKYPRLTQVGSYRPETVIGHNSGKYDGRPHQGFYTQRDIREVVDYARQRHITIIPELNYMTAEEENFSKNFARFINEANVVELSELYERGIRDIGQNANAKIVFFDIALKTIVLLIQK